MKTQGHTRPRPYSPKAIPPSYSVGLGSSATSWAPPRPPSKEHTICLLLSIYVRATSSQHILEYK
ncbi:hypothetical protein Scep_004662 [Stephania cephalantha]|uniref:Uncharacterized protein n=1 Tax=Stephania cephalantha TaxID=152367 RepID=A0AAP0KU99_9MAGN